MVQFRGITLKYCTKAEKSSKAAKDVLGKVMEFLPDDATGATIIRKLFLQHVGTRDVGIREVQSLLLGLPLVRCSHRFETVRLDEFCAFKEHAETDDPKKKDADGKKKALKKRHVDLCGALVHVWRI